MCHAPPIRIVRQNLRRRLFPHVCVLLRRSVSDALLLLRTFLRTLLRNLLRTLLRNLRLQCLYGWVILLPTASVGPSLGEDVLQSQWQTSQVLQNTKLQGLSSVFASRVAMLTFNRGYRMHRNTSSTSIQRHCRVSHPPASNFT